MLLKHCSATSKESWSLSGAPMPGVAGQSAPLEGTPPAAR
jgi:hypothetical protein